MADDGRRRSRLAGWTAAEEDGDAAASAVLSGEYQALEMSTMVSALAHVVAGGDDEGYPPAAMAAGGSYVQPAQQWGGSYSSAAARTPDHFFPAGEPSLYSILVYGSTFHSSTLL